MSLWLCWPSSLPAPLIVAQGTAVFSRIDVAGNQRIEADTIRAFAGIEPGQPVTPEQLNLAVRKLFDTGLFEDVTVMPEAGRLVITVKENPTINQIAFEGNDSLDDEELAEVIQLRPRLAYSVPAAEADAQRIIDAYRAAGRYAATVDPVIIRQSENRVDLVFEISEGRKTGVQRISFIGNQRLLGPPAAAGDRDQPDQLAELRLRRQHLRRRQARARQGAAAAVLPRARLHRRAGAVRRPPRWCASAPASSCPSPSPRAQQYNFGKVSVSSQIPGLNAADFQPLLAPVADRGVYNVKLVDRVVQRMSYQAGQAGYAFVEIRPRVTKNAANRTVDINFEIVEGQRVFVERIDITGNTRTLDRVIRRQFHIVEGDAFNSREVKDAEDRINGLGYFKTADGQRAAGHHRGPGAGRRRGRGAADRQPQPRRRLLLQRGPHARRSA